MNLQSLHNAYDGQRLFLIGNGPSLADTPLEKLTDEYTFAMNGVDFIYQDTDWRPSFYLFTQSSFKQTRKSSLQQHVDLDIPCFVNDRHRSSVTGKQVFFLPMQTLKSDPLHPNDKFHDFAIDDVKSASIEQLYKYWSTDIENAVYKYHSMYAAYQIAFYLGFDEIYLLGCDLGFGIHNPHMIFSEGLNPLTYEESIVRYFIDAARNGKFSKSFINWLLYELMTFSILGRRPYFAVSNRVVRMNEQLADPNHFSENYHPAPKDKRYVNDQITKSHLAAKRIAEDQAIEIKNATLGGELEVFPRIDLLDIVE